MAARKRILIVDDDELSRKILSELLKSRYDLATAASGEACLELAPTFQPDVVLLDITMEGIDGYETCRRLRSSEDLGHIKIIMVSATTMPKGRVAGYEAGADDFITKPFDADELHAKLKVFLKLKSVEEVDLMKTRILGLLSHDTRGPLNGIFAPVDMLLDDPTMKPTERSMWLETVRESAQRLHQLLEDILTLSRLRSGHETFEFETLDLFDLAQEATVDLEPAAQRRRVFIRLERTGAAASDVDSEQLGPVLRLLLDNSIRHCPAGCAVIVRVDTSDDFRTITFTREGDAIDAEHLPHLFEEFYAVDAESGPRHDGLGLAIAREIVTGHGGTVDAVSDPDQGTTITVRLPATRGEIEDVA